MTTRRRRLHRWLRLAGIVLLASAGLVASLAGLSFFGLLGRDVPDALIALATFSPMDLLDIMLGNAIRLDPSYRRTLLLLAILPGFALTTVGAVLFLARAVRSAPAIERQSEDRLCSETLPGPSVITRREALTRSSSAAVGIGLAASGAAPAYALCIEPRWLCLRRYRITLKGLPPELNGLRLAHLSDTHLGEFTSLGYLESVVKQTNRLKPDLVLLTGDYVHRSSSELRPGIGVFGKLESRLGLLAVLGNHDHWCDPEEAWRRLGDIGAHVLDNRRVFLTPGRTASTRPQEPHLCIGGVGDLWEGQVLPGKAFDEVAEQTPRILLSHNPDVAESPQATETRVDLMVSGHTHGGQVGFPGVTPPIVPSAFGWKYAGGLCQGPRFPVLVSRGVGTAGLPLRFGCRPEIVLLELVSPNGDEHSTTAQT